MHSLYLLTIVHTVVTKRKKVRDRERRVKWLLPGQIGKEGGKLGILVVEKVHG